MKFYSKTNFENSKDQTVKYNLLPILTYEEDKMNFVKTEKQKEERRTNDEFYKLYNIRRHQ